jgi:mannose-6-phosphate isomerase-like protein (cupin superfamily)
VTADDAFSADLAGGLVAAPDAQIVVAQWEDPGGGGDPPRYIAPLHVHHADDECWYVLEGALVVRSGDRDLDVPAGGAVIVQQGTPHTYWNPRPDPARYLLVMTPRIRALIDALHALAAPTPETVTAVFEQHESEYLGWP